ncbi:ATPase [Brumimicrobium salinarum]|uniref:ATPase n=1 Tax=Brumimicrobium salinarum TaxID=2058658 RepID=A0A2I0R450_9FLAO|nr:ATP-binding protein [Brumimicrobium salinarum]PKR81329.1 ATPase [Brumimicrobium salinarum]
MNIHDLIIKDREVIALDDVFLSNESQKMIQQFIKEYKYVEELSKYNLPVNNTMLLSGSSGCGKTTTAKAIANRLGKKIYVLNLSNIICSKIGETSQNLKQVFDKAGKDKAVLFLDEFDQIGKSRDNSDKEVGEMRRLVNTIIQLMDYYPKEAVLICATNHQEIIDTALLRRFQLRIQFDMPNQEMLDKYYDKLLKEYPLELQDFKRKYDVSYAEAKDYALTEVKSILIEQLEKEESMEVIDDSSSKT